MNIIRDTKLAVLQLQDTGIAHVDKLPLNQ